MITKLGGQAHGSPHGSAAAIRSASMESCSGLSMTEILQILMNTTPGGGAMIASYINRFGSGRVELYPFNPQSKAMQEAGL